MNHINNENINLRCQEINLKNELDLVKQTTILNAEAQLQFTNIYGDLEKTNQLLDNNGKIKKELDRLTKHNNFLNVKLTDANETITKSKEEHKLHIENMTKIQQEKSNINSLNLYYFSAFILFIFYYDKPFYCNKR